MNGQPVAYCEAWGRRPAFGSHQTEIAMAVDAWLSVSGDIGQGGIRPEVSDLLDVAAVVHRAERLLPMRSAANANVRFAMRVPVRDPSSWSGKRGEVLCDLLTFLGNAAWEVKFTQRPKAADDIAWGTGPESDAVSVTLFSGGLDSTCGAGAHLFPRNHHALSSFSTRQGARQREIASSLGLASPTQWKLHPLSGRGRSFHYRSFLFLSIAAALADSLGIKTLYQFENGVLATAIPPVPSLLMTRHAHPRTRELMTSLLAHSLGGVWEIRNPFAWKTKQECFEALVTAIGTEVAQKLGARTESCWNLNVPHVFGISSYGNRRKRNGQHCGVCIPCIVRRTALHDSNYAFDLRSDRIKNHPLLGAHFREYFQFLADVDAAPATPAFWRVLPAEGRDLLDQGYGNLADIERMFRRFSKEFSATFRN
jgi:7-cyano-7-deazaguanine synthase in queuosine biosynthesis